MCKVACGLSIMLAQTAGLPCCTNAAIQFQTIRIGSRRPLCQTESRDLLQLRKRPAQDSI